MKKLIFGILLSSVLIACSDEDLNQPPQDSPLRNELNMQFVGLDGEDRKFGYREKLSSVECRHDSSTGELRVVAYRFVDKGDLQIQESLQLSDYEVQTEQSGSLKTMEEQTVPSFVYLGNSMTLKFGQKSGCQTYYYDIEGGGIGGMVLCSALVDNEGENHFVSIDFQCRKQDYLLFEIKEEMI